MRILDYLKATGEGESQFAMRAGVMPQTFRNIVRSGTTPTLANALKIHAASKEQPAKGLVNGHVTYLEMLPEVAD